MGTLSKAVELRNMVNTTLKSDALVSGSDLRFKMTYTSTGVLPFDIHWQGGIPRGRFIEIYGDWSTLKSYIGLMSIASFQRVGKVAALIDTEHSFDPDWALSCGVNLNDLILLQPESGEVAMDNAETLIRGKCDLIVFDSVAAMTPQAEQQKRLAGENVQPARIASLMSAALRRLMTANTDCSMIWINQLRVNVGVTFGSNEAVPGGKALPYYASFRTSVRKTGKITVPFKMFDGEKWIDTKKQVGQKFKLDLVKSKLSRPFTEEHFVWSLETGSLDMIGYLIAKGIEAGFITQKGNTWSYEDNKAVGREKFRALIESDPDIALDLENAVRDHHNIPRVKETTARVQKTTKAGQEEVAPVVVGPKPRKKIVNSRRSNSLGKSEPVRKTVSRRKLK